MKTNLMALLTALALVGPLSVRAAEPIPFRGVVEGYYGRPWGTEGRLSLLKFMGENDMNVFIYGPKDDPYHHGKWREPYPAAEMADFQKLLKVAKANKILFTWAIHLGGSFKKGNEADYEALFRKLGWMYDAGFRAFAVFFDDFGGADAEFHAEICNRVVTDFLEKKRDCAPLVMCPNVYWGSGHPYQKTLGEKLDPRVNIMWTGAWICHDINAADVKKITENFRRPPYIWWNWPVNDYCRTKILLGRTYGLDQGAYAGFVANPMENCEANKIALYGVAQWCKDPAHFDSQKTWEESFAKLYKDPEVAKAMRVFAEHNSDQGPNGHGYRREESVAVAPLCAKARDEYAKTGALAPATAADLRALFKEVGKACNVLLKLPKERYDLGWEIEGWVEAERYQMAQGLKALEILETKDAAKLRRLYAEVARLRREADAAGVRHQEKFAAATFAGDRNHMKKPSASTRELQPTIERILEGELRKAYEKKTGRSFDAAGGLAGFSDAKALPTLLASRDGKFAGLARVQEQKTLAPGESFGLRVPAKWDTNYFHAKLGENAAVKAGVIELSKDGETWTKLDTDNSGEQMQKRLNPKDGWRFARYRNVSSAPVSLKVNLFKFDVIAPASSIDELLDVLN